MKIVSKEPLRVTTLGGTAVLFEAGIPREISAEIGLIAIQMGAQEYNEKKIEESEAEAAVFEKIEGLVTQTSPVLVDDELVTFLEKMMDEGDPSNFKADGYPKAAAVNKALGRTVGTDAREVAWESILNS
jgi:hypothetical protein